MSNWHPCTIPARFAELGCTNLCNHGRQTLSRFTQAPVRGATVHCASANRITESRDGSTFRTTRPRRASARIIPPARTASSSWSSPIPARSKLEAACSGQMGYVEVARHKAKNISLYRQGSINYLHQPRSGRRTPPASSREHGPSRARRWRGAWPTPGRRLSARHRLRCDSTPGRRYRRSTCRRSSASAARCSYFVDRYGAKGSPLRRTSSTGWSAADPEPQGVGFSLSRPPDAQCLCAATWTPGTGFYAESCSTSAQIRFFDIEGKLTGLHQPRADLALRQDPHPDQRERRRQEPDRGVPAAVQGRGHPAHRGRHRRHLRRRPTRSPPTRPAVHARARPTPTTQSSRSACRATASRSTRMRAARHPDRRRRRGRTAAQTSDPAADLLQDRDRPDLLRVHPDARATTASARATSARCSRSIEEDQIRRGVLKASWKKGSLRARTPPPARTQGGADAQRGASAAHGPTRPLRRSARHRAAQPLPSLRCHWLYVHWRVSTARLPASAGAAIACAGPTVDGEVGASDEGRLFASTNR